MGLKMNVYNLADRLQEFYSGTHIIKAAETLRQQQAEIDLLKDALEVMGIDPESILKKAQNK